MAVSLIVLAAALTLADVVMRSVVRHPLFGTNDVVIILLTIGILRVVPVLHRDEPTSAGDGGRQPAGELRVLAGGAFCRIRASWLFSAPLPGNFPSAR